MPTDSRRVTGPSETLDPVAFAADREGTGKEQLLRDGVREDGRKDDQIRPLFLQAGIITQAKGSAYIEVKHTKVICAVYGPRESIRREDFSMKGQLNCELKFATFSCPQRRSHQGDLVDKDYSVLLMDALEPAVCLEKYPKSVIDVFVTVLQNDGSAFAAAVTCAAVALADAEIEMYDVVIGTCVRHLETSMITDPVFEEEYSSQVCPRSESNSMVTVAYMPSINQVSAVEMRGAMPLGKAQQAIKLGINSCHRIYPVVQKCLLDSVKEKLQEKT